MRKILAVGLVALALAGCATVETVPPLSVAEVVPIEGKSASQLCHGARDWAALTFRDSKSVIQVFDADRGQMIGRGVMPVYVFGSPISVTFTMSVECKDGCIRASFNDYATSYMGQDNPLVVEGPSRIQSQAAARTKELISSLGAHLRDSKKSDNW